MPLDLCPDNRGIIAILDAQIDGPYRFVHHALVPYVRVGPSTPETPIRIRAGTDLVLKPRRALRLQGLQDTHDFMVYLGGAHGVSLKDIDCMPERKALANKALHAIMQRMALDEASTVSQKILDSDRPVKVRRMLKRGSS